MVNINLINTFTVLIIFGNLQDILGVQITKLNVPRRASHEAPLDCRYDLEKALLYDVKWYKDGIQFFRCLPDGKTFEYPLEGIKIVQSNNAHVGSCSFTLMMLSPKSSGDYKCEVSTEGPTFKTAVASSKLFIIEVKTRGMQNETESPNKNGYYESHTTDVGMKLGSNYVIEIINFILLIINYHLA